MVSPYISYKKNIICFFLNGKIRIKKICKKLKFLRESSDTKNRVITYQKRTKE